MLEVIGLVAGLQMAQVQPDPICLAAAERMMEFAVAEVENNPALNFNERMQTPEGRGRNHKWTSLATLC